MRVFALAPLPVGLRTVASVLTSFSLRFSLRVSFVSRTLLVTLLGHRTAERYFLRKRSSRTTSPLPVGLSGSGGGSGLAGGATVRFGAARAPLSSAGGRTGAGSRPLALGALSSAAASASSALDLLEPHLEWHGRIDKPLNRREGNREAFGDAAEGEADLKALLGDHKVPELVLQDDGHFLGILRAHARR